MMWDLLEMGVPTALAVVCWRRSVLERAYWLRERRLREELEEYARLDVSPTAAGAETPAGADRIVITRALARRVCRAVAEQSAFTRVLLLLRSAEGRLVCVGSSGVDDLTLTAVEAWGEQVMAEERGAVEGNRSGTMGGRTAAASVAISLGEWGRFDPEISSWALSGKVERRRWRRAIAVPVRTLRGVMPQRMAGAIVVCGDGLAERVRDAAGFVKMERLLSPVEVLAARLSASLEAEALGARLSRAEKLAGLGQLAGGVADALREPLTAVMGFAELIAESDTEPRVTEDARKISFEARRMRETLTRLRAFWRPGVLELEPVRLDALLRELSEVWTLELKGKRVRLELVVNGEIAAVPGSRERMRELVEHLLQHASAAVCAVPAREDEEERVVRVSLAEDAQRVHLVVSHTGKGFPEPGRVFDPLQATRESLEGSGLGLSLCFGIVREHGGEIAAFNLHPRGAAVVVELPRGVEAAPGKIEAKRVARNVAVRADAEA